MYYYSIVIWVFAVFVVSNMSHLYRQEYVLNVKKTRYYPFWAFLIFLPVIIWATFRGNFIDTFQYRTEFLVRTPDSWAGVSTYLSDITKDKGFYFCTAVIKIIFGNHDVVYFFIIALVQAVCLIAVYRKYSENYAASFALFILSTDYLAWMFNGLRQFTAACLVFAGTTLMMKKKYISCVLLILFASLFHQSALVFIPFLFLCQGKPWNKKMILFLIVVLLAVGYVGQFTDLLDSMLSDTQYSTMVTDYQWVNDDGTNMFRVLVYSVPMLLSILGMKYIKHENDPFVNFCVNMSIVTSGIYFISMYTSGIYIGRLPIYFSLYNYILLPWEMNHMFEEKTKNIMYIAMFGAYLIFYYYQVHIVWGVI